MGLNPIISEGLHLSEEKAWIRKLLGLQILFLLGITALTFPGESVLFYVSLRISPSYFSTVLLSGSVLSFLLYLAGLSKITGEAERTTAWINYTSLKRITLLSGKILLPLVLATFFLAPLFPFLIFTRQVNNLPTGTEVYSLLFLFLYFWSFGLFSSLLNLILGKYPQVQILILWLIAALQLLFTYRILPGINPILSLGILGQGDIPGQSVLSLDFLKASNTGASTVIIIAHFLLIFLWREQDFDKDGIERND